VTDVYAPKKPKVQHKDLKAMKREEARVLVAKDALALLESNAMIPSHGYLGTLNVSLDETSSIKNIKRGESEAMEEDIDWGKDSMRQAREVVEDLPVCAVCALGALFIAAVRRFNNITVGEIGEGAHYRIILVYLSDLWTPMELVQIEDAYENTRPANNGDFYNKHPRDIDRLKAIMKNIIKNNGTFTI